MPIFRVAKPRTTVRLNANRVLTGNDPLVPWDEVVEEEGTSLWVAGAPTLFTLPQAGVWLAVASAQRSSSASNLSMIVHWLINGADGADSVRTAGPAAANNTQAAQCTLLQWFPSGTTLSVRVRSTAGGETFAANKTRATVLRVGPERWT